MAVRRVVFGLIAACGCGADIEFGTYALSNAHQQDTGAAFDVSSATATVMPSKDGIVLSSDPSAYLLSPIELARRGDDYFLGYYSTGTDSCDSPDRACLYQYQELTVTVPSSGMIHIEQCDHQVRDECTTPMPTCLDVDHVKVGPCTVLLEMDGTVLPSN
jgi:hypothetical protein